MGEGQIRLPDTIPAYAAVITVQNAVEGILQDSFGEINDFDHLRGMLSTTSFAVDPRVDAGTVYDNCLYFSDEIAIPLRRSGYEAGVSQSATYEAEPFNHVYVTVRIDGVEVLVDPTIGQFLYGYNHVFVGTREALRDLVVNQVGEGKKYNSPTYFHAFSSEGFFRTVWGETSEPFRSEREASSDSREDNRARASIGDRLRLYQ